MDRETPGQESQHGDDIFLLRTQGSCDKINSQPPLVLTNLRMGSPTPKVPFPSLEYPHVLGHTISTPERPPLSISSKDNLLLERPIPSLSYSLHNAFINPDPTQAAVKHSTATFYWAEMNTPAITLRQGLT